MNSFLRTKYLHLCIYFNLSSTFCPNPLSCVYVFPILDWTVLPEQINWIYFSENRNNKAKLALMRNRIIGESNLTECSLIDACPKCTVTFSERTSNDPIWIFPYLSPFPYSMILSHSTYLLINLVNVSSKLIFIWTESGLLNTLSKLTKQC